MFPGGNYSLPLQQTDTTQNQVAYHLLQQVLR